MSQFLFEYLPPRQTKSTVFTEDAKNGGKNLYMKGICMQGDILNANQRVYPASEISRAITSMSQIIGEYGGILGEMDHPEDLKINLDRASHTITEVWMDGVDGYGKLKILPTPMGKIIEAMLVSDVILGVSTRGSGNVDERNGYVSDYEIITIDIVAQPSAKDAYPKAVYESLMNEKGGLKALMLAEGACDDPRIQKQLKKELVNVIHRLKWK